MNSSSEVQLNNFLFNERFSENKLFHVWSTFRVPLWRQKLQYDYAFWLPRTGKVYKQFLHTNYNLRNPKFFLFFRNSNGKLLN